MSAAWLGILVALAVLTTWSTLFHHYVVRVRKARAWLARGAALVDVDPPRIFARRHPVRAISIPLEEIARRATDIGSAKQPVVVFAHSWRRGAMAAHELRRRGFVAVTNAAGLHTLDKLAI